VGCVRTDRRQMAAVPIPDEILKALLTAVGTALISRAQESLKSLPTPTRRGACLTMPGKRLQPWMPTLTKIMTQLNQLPPGTRRDQLQAELNQLLERVNASQQKCSDELLEK
jgi:hypothetical protein